ncbi:MAG: 50S ribosomal protein L9 [Candidatus Aminicenantes bacterium]|nr:50S ribosomal protein L9 [Candidatus Aminicenantes bacterium]
MKVILTADVDKIGNLGDIIEVKKGFARNFLLPRKYAVEVTDHNVTLMENKKKKHQKQLELEKLFGSVTISELEKELKALGISVEKKKLHLDEPIKRLGNYTLKIKLFQDVEAEIKIAVLQDGDASSE